MHSDDQHPVIAAAVDELAVTDPEVAQDAEAALGWLSGGEGPEVITQEGLQTFLWYALPTKWLTDSAHHRRVVEALACAFDALQMPRYAQLCRGEQTAAVLAAYERSEAEGRRAFTKAADASVMRPPDTPELEWGVMTGPEEATARSAVAEHLELAIADGELVPGTSGWRQRQAELVRSFLAVPQIRLGGRTLLDAVRAERLERWLDGHRSPTRRRLLQPLVDDVREPARLPEDAHDPVPSLRWLLDQLVEGQPLTQTGNLNRAFVQDAATRFGWWDLELHSLPRSEPELYDLHQLRSLTQRLGLARRTGRRLVLTRTGRGLRTDPEALWRRAAGGVLHDDPFTRAVGEIVLALLVGGQTASSAALHETVAQVVGEEGWRDVETRLPADEHAVSRALHATTNLLRALDQLAVGAGWDDDGYALTATGRATALQALHASATGPIRDPRASR